MVCVKSVSRHDGVWLCPNWRRFLMEPLAPDCEAPIESWRSRNLPFVVARGQKDDPADSVRLGLSQPDRRRIGMFVHWDAVERAAPPPLLADVVPSAPSAWRKAMASLAVSAAALGAAPRVYGSIAWRFYSGDAYVKHDSDVDLLFAPTGWLQAETLLDLLTRLPEPPSWDGEFLLRNGWAVAWRELIRRPPTVLLKGLRGLELKNRKDVLAAFDAEQTPGRLP